MSLFCRTLSCLTNTPTSHRALLRAASSPPSGPVDDQGLRCGMGCSIDQKILPRKSPTPLTTPPTTSPTPLAKPPTTSPTAPITSPFASSSTPLATPPTTSPTPLAITPARNKNADECLSPAADRADRRLGDSVPHAVTERARPDALGLRGSRARRGRHRHGHRGYHRLCEAI